MDTNRFAPPGAQVADVALEGDGYQAVRFWPPNGRIGRLRFLAYGLGLYVLLTLASVVLGIVSGALRAGPAFTGVVGVIGLVVYVVAAATLLIQRSHDMDMAGWWSIAAVIPLIGLVWVFKGGTPRANRWGAPPPPNGWVVRIAGLFLPVVMVIGLVAAIALPSYQMYVLRARANAAR
jgi:uncharacterized membrane protein YhaH (DUF805 family)